MQPTPDRYLRQLCAWPRALTLGLGVALSAFAHGSDWPQWRGPLLNGSSTATNLPVQWNKTDDALWKLPLPGRSGATPVVSADRVFVTSPDEQKALWLLSVDRRTGKEVWRRKVASGDQVVAKNNMATPSPIIDGQRVVATFGTGDVAAYDFDGKELWHYELKRDFGTPAVQFLYGATPLLWEGRLYLQLMQRHPATYGHAQDQNPERKSWLICLDPASGKTLWRQERPTDAKEESMEAYTTPMPRKGAAGTEIVLVGADCVTGHALADGKELWRWNGLNTKRPTEGRVVPSPLIHGDLVFAVGPKREKLLALRPPATLGGESTVVWQTTQYAPDVCTPLLYMGRLFVLDGDRQTLTCYEPTTGEKHWQGKFPVREIFNASPIGADGKLYCLSEEGTVVVAGAGEKFEVLGTVPLGEGPCMSSIVPVDGQLFIRTSQNLYCFGKP